MRVLVFGGTFNPVHVGHLFIAEDARKTAGYDSVLFVPSSIPVHKSTGELIDSAHRLEMLALALDGNACFSADDCEILRGGPSYTIDTIEFLHGKYRIDGKPGLLIGDDLAEGFGRWKEADRLSSITDIVVARRAVGGRPDFQYPHVNVENIFMPISSSDIRRRVREGRTIRYLVPDRVFEYITERGLYRG